MWMLAVVFLLLIGPVYFVLAWVEMFPERPVSWWAIDLLLGTSILALAVKLLASVTFHNWRVSQAMNALAAKGEKAQSDEQNGASPHR